MSSLFRALALSLTLPFLMAANSAPQPVPIASTIPVAQDVAYPGTIRLSVEATDLDRGIVKVRETIPVAGPGSLVLLLPQWLPGNHAPRGAIEKLAGLEISAGSKPIAWRRDPVDPYAFHVDVPVGVGEIEARFVHLSATAADQGRITVTREMMNIQWEAVSLYPAGYFTRRIPIIASLTIPAGWRAATALRPTASAGGRIDYGQVNYEVLQDSPVFAGKYFRADDLGHGVTLNSFADSAKELAIPPAVLAKHRNLADQAVKLFGARHFDHYDFLHAVTDRMGGIGLEHHRSSENQNEPGYFIDWQASLADHNLLPHEFTHSWNGKFRRGADLWTPDFKTPMRDSLLWVYEGQTQFWGYVLEARSGLSTKQEVLDKLAVIAAGLDTLPGRQWRPLIDTTNDPIISARRPKGWASFQRSEDYYNEGLLIWTEADAIIREGTGGKRGMDDFARAFFGINDGDYGEVTYTFDDIVATLNRVYPYDWSTHLRQRLDGTSTNAPLAGFTRSGYRLAYTDTPTAAAKAFFKAREAADFTYSLGLSVGKEAKVASVLWGSPAFVAGLTVGQTIVSVDGHTYSDDVLKDAIVAAKGGNQPIRLITKRGEEVRPVEIRWNGGHRYPRFEKVGKGEGPLDRLLKPR
ncbi:MAG: M61 family metallopeptidase [Sphingomonas sp.]|uniref:M61 family metallopeptidase n=1 Tax=Sphingomonas sp. TaxID=28214 RepID=UPI001820724E|nr:peptidase M61 [Sphingomonas sp.]MBA3668164.1 M61 family metallopeptidase [Sphingomonas sp.]